MKFENEFKNAWTIIDEDEFKMVMQYGDRYINFLNNGKTERECVKRAKETAIENGFISLEEVLSKGHIAPGDKIYYAYRDKSIALYVIGEEDLEKGFNLVAAHIDTPRIDLKQKPLYEDDSLALFKSHYYGGIKKYQWTTIPLALHGVIMKENGETVNIVFGEDESDPVLYITDLLPHLAQDQMNKTLGEGILGEHLTPLVGHIPTKQKDNTYSVKATILNWLHDKYEIVEQDFISAELEIVPAGKARSVGFDSSMIMGHGHDDRVCSYAAFEAVLHTVKPQKTAIALLIDKEENMSRGNTGMESKFFENSIAELMALKEGYSELKLRRAFGNSFIISADVCSVIDPNYPEVNDPKNAAKFGYGVNMFKYTGGKGKMNSNDSNPEFVVKLRKIFNDNKIAWQTGEIGKIDHGGGGTIAFILARYGAEVIDCGTGVLSMHAPFEVVSKVDAYMTCKAYHAFFK